MKAFNTPACQSTEHVFHEIPTSMQSVITSCQIELLVLPFSAKDITDQFLVALFDTPSRNLKSFIHLNCVAILLASLPKPFHQQIYERALVILKNDKLFSIDFAKRVKNIEENVLIFLANYGSSAGKCI